MPIAGPPPPANAIVPITPGFAGSSNPLNPLWDGSPLNPNFIPPTAYVNAFDPSGMQYSVNTDNASVRDLETLNSIFSSPPTQTVGTESTPLGQKILLGIGALGLYLLF